MAEIAQYLRRTVAGGVILPHHSQRVSLSAAPAHAPASGPIRHLRQQIDRDTLFRNRAARAGCYSAPESAAVVDPVQRAIEDATSRIAIPDFRFETAAEQEQRYLQLDRIDPGVTFIRSSLGTGKTEQLSLIVTQEQYRTLVVSHRITFTDSLVTRYPGIVSYQDIQGAISLEEHRIVACQIESLSRIAADEPIDILVLDEIESLLSQLAGTVAAKQGAHSAFVVLLRRATRVVVLDGHLQEATMRLIEYLRGDTGDLILNRFRPYSTPCTIHPCNKKIAAIQFILTRCIENAADG